MHAYCLLNKQWLRCSTSAGSALRGWASGCRHSTLIVLWLVGVDDLNCLIHHLKLNRYRLFNVSGGAGYALACAKLLPRDQLRAVGIGFGMGPLEVGLEGTSLLNCIGLWIWEKHPWFFESISDRYVVPKVQGGSSEKTEEMIRKQINNMPKKYRQALGREEVIQGLAKITK